MSKNKNYDFIIVGGGTSGIITATKLIIINKPIKIMLDVCPAPQNIPLNEETIVRLFKLDFFESVALFLFFNKTIPVKIRK